MKEKNVAIIPARGGSKRIPKKNVKLFFGKPIIEYSIKAALKSGCFSEVMVSTDDPEIAKIAKCAGASVPFLRSKAHSRDKSSIEDVAIEVLEEYNKQEREFKNFCCLLATAPFIKAEDIRKAMKILESSRDIISIFTVVRYSYPIQRALKIKKEWLRMKYPENINKHSQEIEPMYHDAGQFYCLKTKKFLKEKQFFSKKSKAIILPETRVQDIDTIEDWQMAEIKYEILEKPTKIERN